MIISKWGNSLAIRLPKSITEALALHAGDDVELTLVNPNLLKLQKRDMQEQQLKRLEAFRGKLPINFKFDREEANRRD